MKKTFLIAIAILFSLSITAQIDNNRRQVSPRVNLSVLPHVELANVAGNMNLAAGISLTTTINNKFYYGFSITKKLQKTYSDFGVSSQNLDFSFQHAGLILGGYVNLGIYKGKEGRYLKRKTSLTYSGKIAAAAFWTANESAEKISGREYFYIFQPALGLTRTVGKFVDVELGAKYQLAYRVDSDWETNYNLTDSDFSGLGAYLAIRFSLFR